MDSEIDVPDCIESASAKLIYVFVGANGGATIEEVCAGLSLSRLNVCGVLPVLLEKGVMERVDERLSVLR